MDMQRISRTRVTALHAIRRACAQAQDDIDLFARVTRDNDPMHVDPVWSVEKGPFPTTVAFGFLTLSLITYMSHEAGLWTDPDAYALNYGFDRVRFINPVKVGSNIRASSVLSAVELKDPAAVHLTRTMTVEIDGESKPALVADWVVRLVFA